jgi:import inner membrane translocase subunit TIM10
MDDNEDCYATSDSEVITDDTNSNRLVTSCHRKCIAPEGEAHRYVEGDLLKGEGVCIDRCTAKFFEVSHPHYVLLHSSRER